MARFLALVSLALALIVTATPTPERRLTHVPREATKLAADPETGTIYLFNSRDEPIGSMDGEAAETIHRRAGGCSDISADEVQKLPGWGKLKDTANSMWGDYQREIKTNNPDFPDKPAAVCITNNDVDITINGDPQCTTQSQSIGGSVDGTNGTVMLQQTEGTVYTLETTTTTQASVALGISASATFKIPEVAEDTFSTSLTTTVTNTLGKTESSSSNQQTTSTVTAQQKDGQTCKLDFETKTCTTKGSGQLPFVASGWVWFVYKNKTKDHWNWALLMEAYLDEGERSTYMNFDSAVGTETKSQYNVVCQ
ncbi:uncharacterized protein SCHCODRAFT_02626523 [Schizophyllum commune H4-8]|uniref:uncharacterized protein n=1 Tax=Schizophyllum commune (strain H4-8 / FGSC 9210) TaxID=578458 RepID=UPI00215EC7F1|nr:uncharacterized protein SCHCODRAFT_02626523 [Schizophyllum commune H4-8]KAI5892582.1 hypothetical protein SCHCODRAFT_02626523 [Schizophyllum commune H4-8]